MSKATSGKIVEAAYAFERAIYEVVTEVGALQTFYGRTLVVVSREASETCRKYARFIHA